MSGPLDDIDSRLRWAGDHIQKLDKDIRTFLEDGSLYEITVEPQADGVTYIYKVENGRPLPSDFRFRVGDCIHNLRASLDNIAYGLVSTYHTPADTISFPVCYTIKSFQRNALPYFAGVDQGAIDIIESVQPYNDPDGIRGSWLRILNRRWNFDKHRVPTLVGVIPGQFSYLEGDGDIADYAIYTDMGLKDGMPVGHVRYRSRQHTRRQPHFSFEIAIEETGTPVIWRDMPGALQAAHHAIANGYTGVLDKLRPFFR